MKNWILFLALMLVLSPAYSKMQRPDEIHVSLVETEHGIDTLTGNFSIAASTSIVWDVLTDYDHMAEFVSSIKKSHRLEGHPDRDLVEQVMSGKAVFFHKKIYLLLLVSEDLGKKISFEDIGKKSFKTYHGSWDIIPQDNKTQVTYSLAAQPDFFAPDFVADSAFKNTVKVLLSEVRNEISLRLRETSHGESRQTTEETN